MFFDLMKKHADSPDVVAHPPILFGVGFLIGILADHWLGASFALGDALQIGYLFLFGGFALAAWSVWELRAGGTNIPTNMPANNLITTGPFRNTRNPIYIGLAISYLGLASILDAPIALLMLVPVLLVLHAGVVLREEAYLIEKFGDAYLQYAARTKRYF